jgi:hypothetical protein
VLVPDRNPALKPLQSLVGEWEMELSNAAFLQDPSASVKGSASIAWVENGAFLMLSMGGNAIWLISRDASVPDYTVFYYDNRQVSRIYAMSFMAGIWKIWRNSPGFSQRFEARLSADGNSIKGAWEKSPDGKNWEHDFDVTYTRRNRNDRSSPA